jgi:hypothetical protein
MTRAAHNLQGFLTMNTGATWIDSPATKLVATHCACCAHPLVDAASVETGIGPDCRKKHGFAEAQGPADWEAFLAITGGAFERVVGDARVAANLVVHRIAVAQRGPDVGKLVAALGALGFATLARRIATRLGAVEIVREGDTLIVKTPRGLDEPSFRAFLGAVRRVPGNRWDSGRKARVVPMSSRRELWHSLQRGLAKGTLVIGDKIGAI